MKKSLLFSLIVAGFVMIQCEKAPDADKAQVEEPTNETTTAPTGEPVDLNIETSLIKWIGTKVTGKHNGIAKIKSGKVLINENKVTGGEFEIDMTTIEDKDLDGEMKEKLEKHLKSTDFFEVQKFPTASFKISKIEPEADGSKVKVTGNLTMRNITKSITFPATIEYGEDKKPKAAKANFNIDRQLWGIVYKGKADDLIRNEINLDLDLRL
ncbi:MAG: YceI family protein [Spirochaetota bacterium]